MRCVAVVQNVVFRNTVFRLEVPVTGTLSALGTHTVEYVRYGEKWIMEVKHDFSYSTCGFSIDLRAADSVKTFTYKTYVRSIEEDILYENPNTFIRKGLAHDMCILGAEVTLPQHVPSTSPWNFTSSDNMENWDVILNVGETKLYAHKEILSFASSTFRAMFEGEFREKNQKEIPVNVEGINARHFEAFLQSIYPCGSEHNGEFVVQLLTLADFYNVKSLLTKCLDMLKFLQYVSNVEKLRIAVKFNSTSLEDVVITSLSKADIDALIAAGFKDIGDDRWQKVVARCRSMMP